MHDGARPEKAGCKVNDTKEPLEIIPVQDTGVVLMPVMNIASAKARLVEFQAFVKDYLVKDEDYGTIPGTPKPTLLKPGADKLTEIYGLADDYAIETRVENYQSEPPLFDYTIKCTLTTRRDGRLVGTGLGSCNSWEGKYRFRQANRKCPLCGKEAIIKGKEEYGGGWLCFKKKDGCGAKFAEGDKSIEGQESGKVANDDICTLKNTILKMAKKRAKIDAVIAVTRSSGIFTQDMEDMEHDSNGHTAPQTLAEGKVVKPTEKKAPASPQATKTASPEPSQLCVYPIGKKYGVTGDSNVMNNNKDLLLHYGVRPNKNADYVLMDADNLESFKYDFVTMRHNILIPLKEAREPGID